MKGTAVAEDEGTQLRDLTPEEAAQLRAQMEDLLKGADQARAASASDEEGMRYGREMWARCEALTAGAVPAPLDWPRISCGMLLPGLSLKGADMQSRQRNSLLTPNVFVIVRSGERSVFLEGTEA